MIFFSQLRCLSIKARSRSITSCSIFVLLIRIEIMRYYLSESKGLARDKHFLFFSVVIQGHNKAIMICIDLDSLHVSKDLSPFLSFFWDDDDDEGTWRAFKGHVNKVETKEFLPKFNPQNVPRGVWSLQGVGGATSCHHVSNSFGSFFFRYIAFLTLILPKIANLKNPFRLFAPHSKILPWSFF